jgi:hypothetical protein
MLRQVVDGFLKISNSIVITIFVSIDPIIGVKPQLTFPRIGNTVLSVSKPLQ